MGTMMDVLAVGGAVSAFTMPGAVWALIGMSRSCQKLEARNAAQGVTIAGLQARLERAEVWRMAWQREDDAKSCQIGTAGRDLGYEAGGSTSAPHVGAVRPFSDDGGR